MTAGTITQELVEAARRRESDAIEAVYRALSPSVFGYVLNQTHNATWADDVTADTFVEAVRSLPRFQGTPDGLRAWIFRIARNTLIDHIRRESRRAHAALDEAAEVADQSRGPETEAVSTAERGRVARYVDDLPADQREVVLLRLVAELPITEVAGLVGKTEGAVKALQHRALQGLARRMQRAGEGPES